MDPFDPRGPVPVEFLFRSGGDVITSIELAIEIRTAAFAEKVCIIRRRA